MTWSVTSVDVLSTCISIIDPNGENQMNEKLFLPACWSHDFYQ